MANIKHNFLPVLTLFLFILQVFLILFSWIVTSVFPSLAIKSVLSEEGIRWLFGNITVNISSPLLVWFLLCSMAYGAFSVCGLKDVVGIIIHKGKITYRQRHALCAVIVVLLLCLIVISFLAFKPHAILLGVSGDLFPGPFCSGMIPMFAFIAVIISLVYGILSGKLHNIRTAFRSLYAGILISAPLFPVYFLSRQLLYMTKFVFA